MYKTKNFKSQHNIDIVRLILYLSFSDETHFPGGMRRSTRNVVGFWLLGLFNNYCYVIMLSAAHDLLRQTETETERNARDCNALSTGTILLADVVPGIIIKSFAPFYFSAVSMEARVGCVVGLSSLSYLLVWASLSPSLTLAGVVCASLASGLGEASFLSHTHLFSEPVISAWSSGTGASGVIGAGSYAGLTGLGVPPRLTVLVMLVVPLCLGLTFWSLLEPSLTNNSSEYFPLADTADQTPPPSQPELSSSHQSFQHKLSVLRGLAKFMVPLGFVYFFEYLINQGLFELLYFPGSSLSHSQQYRWYQLTYQCGVLVSRSSLSCLSIHRISLLAGLQGINLLLLSWQAVAWSLAGDLGLTVIFLMIFWEGLLGGAAYVNTFFRISEESEARDKQFALGIASLADSSAIGLAGLAALPLHNIICDLPVTSL